MGLYFFLDRNVSETDTAQKGIPVKQPMADDTKTIFLHTGSDRRPFFFLFKFNAIQSKVSIVSISPDYRYSHTQRTLKQSMEKAGVMQCVLDTKEEFGINIDYYISCGWKHLGEIIQDFDEFGIDELGDRLPVPLKNFLLKEAEKLDTDSLINAIVRREGFLNNDVGLAFLNECAYILVKYNGENLPRYAGRRMKSAYTDIDTNINTEVLKKLERIVTFIDPKISEYVCEVITAADSNAHRKITRAING